MFSSFSESLVTRLLLSDAGFQLSGLEFMLGTCEVSDKPPMAIAAAKKTKDKQFDFRNCKFITLL